MTNYYLLGTKYGEGNNKDIFPHLIQERVIAVGFAWDTDLSEFYNSDLDGLKKRLLEQNEISSTIGQLGRFLSLKEGDIIALKSTGSPKGKTPYLEIVGYAIVTKRDGKLYNHSREKFPNGLGHTINVEFLEYGFKKVLPLGGYGQSVHHITEKDRIDKIYGAYSDWFIQHSFRKGTTNKSTKETEVIISASYIRKQIHNKIQKSIYKKWVAKVGEKNVKMEANFVDISVKCGSSTILIEVKPYNSARQCIIEGLGQLIGYYERSYKMKYNIRLVIIGAKIPSDDDISYISFIKENLKFNFEYDSWENIIKNGVK